MNRELSDPGPLIRFGRPMPGTVGETRRVTHIFPAPHNYPGNVTAYCGEVWWTGDLDWLDEPHGMPCEICLACSPSDPSLTSDASRASLPSPAADAAAGHRSRAPSRPQVERGTGPTLPAGAGGPQTLPARPRTGRGSTQRVGAMTIPPEVLCRAAAAARAQWWDAPPHLQDEMWEAIARAAIVAAQDQATEHGTDNRGV